MPRYITFIYEKNKRDRILTVTRIIVTLALNIFDRDDILNGSEIKRFFIAIGYDIVDEINIE